MKPSFNKYNKYNNNKTSKDKKQRGETSHKKMSETQKQVTNPLNNPKAANNNQIISGYFLNEKPYKEMVIQRVNNFLYGILALLVIFCLVCYYFVSCKEVQLNQISRETLELNYENEELQNKVDSLQSYYNIDKAVQKTNILQRAKHVVEVDAIDLPNLNLKNKNNHSLVVGY